MADYSGKDIQHLLSSGKGGDSIVVKKGSTSAKTPPTYQKMTKKKFKGGVDQDKISPMFKEVSVNLHEAYMKMKAGYKEQEIIKHGNDLFNWFTKGEGSTSVWFWDYFILQGISRRTVYDWVKKYPFFAEIFNIVKDIQESKVYQGGLLENFNPTCVIFGLKNFADWKDKQEINQTINKSVNELSDAELESFLKNEKRQTQIKEIRKVQKKAKKK